MFQHIYNTMSKIGTHHLAFSAEFNAAVDYDAYWFESPLFQSVSKQIKCNAENYSICCRLFSTYYGVWYNLESADGNTSFKYQQIWQLRTCLDLEFDG